MIMDSIYFLDLFLYKYSVKIMRKLVLIRKLSYYKLLSPLELIEFQVTFYSLYYLDLKL